MEDNEIKKLLLQYNEILAKLKENDVIRTSKLVGEYGEYVVSKKLNLKRLSSGNKGHDAVDSDGKKYEIKARKNTPYNKINNFAVGKEQLEIADFLVCVEFDNDWNLMKLYKIPTSEVVLNSYGRLVVTKSLEKYDIL